MTSARDAALVARFEVLRAFRTWRAVALLCLYGIAYAGAAYVFVMIIFLMEKSVAEGLGIATMDVPGAMLGDLVKTDMFRDVVLGVTGNENLVDELVQTPPLALFAMWFGLLLGPFFASSAAAECISIDMGSRALRYELLRTGRLELLLGRFGGQLFLTLCASVAAVLTTWGVGMVAMVGNPPVGLAISLTAFTFKAWMFSVPFVAIGVTASALTTSPAWARVLAIGATTGTWFAFFLARYLEGGPASVVADVMLQLLPQGWMQGLWEPGFGWLPSALVCVTLGMLVVTLGYARFQGRDL